jgi:sarcosine oxidase, subunit beta
MKRSAEAVIIGGGVVGCSIAYQLARRGLRDVVVLERDQVASGASSRCPGGFRHQWATEADILLMKASIEMFISLQEELSFSHDLEVRQIGYMFLIYTEDELAQYERNVRLQRSLGIPVELLSPQDGKSLAPPLNTEGLLAVAYCPWDGRANPMLVTYAYAWAAKRLGVQIDTETEATGVLSRGDGAITGVVTNRGTVETRRVICVAGAHSPAIARMAGIEGIPIRPALREVLVVERVARAPCPALMSPYVGYFQTRDGDVLPELKSPDVEKFDYSRTTLRSLKRMAAGWMKVAPVLGDIRVIRSWAGLYDMTPDAHPIVGPVPGAEGFYMAAGFSGHGFMMAPIVGRVMAELILGEPASVDISSLQAQRFSGAGSLVEKMVY